jgi:hypothetical protein
MTSVDDAELLIKYWAMIWNLLLTIPVQFIDDVKGLWDLLGFLVACTKYRPGMMPFAIVIVQRKFTRRYSDLI